MKKFECTVCGYIHYGEEPPAICPKCKQPSSVFKEVKEESKEEKSGESKGFFAKLFGK